MGAGARADPSFGGAGRRGGGIRANAQEPANKISGSYYRRPAKALERGGGFYVPGLEGDRLRIAVASSVSLTLLANHLASVQPVAPAQVTSELLGGALTFYVLLQVVVERLAASARERAVEARDLAVAMGAQAPAGYSDLGLGGSQTGSESGLSARAGAEFEWAARATLDSTAADALLLVGADGSLRASCARPGLIALPDSLLAAQRPDPAHPDRRWLAAVGTCCARADAPLPSAMAADGAALLLELWPTGAAAGFKASAGPDGTSPGSAPRTALLARVGAESALFALSAREGAFVSEDALWLAAAAARIGAELGGL
ncbi:hypothetical protein T492DRAFT_1047490 [Pavlovales sp. CCMP2436]|nr:hypothetical protein T492DRAFT_1047490 [Pavlovales sp. CCMP2436]